VRGLFRFGPAIAEKRAKVTDQLTKLNEDRRAELDRLGELVIETVTEQELREARESSVARVRLLWSNRRFVAQAMACGFIGALIIAFLIPRRFQAVTRLMPPDQTSGASGAMFAALTDRIGSDIANAAQGVLGLNVKTSGDLFIAILKSDTVRDDLIHKFSLQRLYHDRYMEDCRQDLASRTDVSDDAKSGIITIKVSDHNARRAAAMDQEYVNELNWVVNNLNTSSAHRERVFLDQRLDEVKRDLESSETQFSHFASQKGAVDVPTQARAALETAAALQGQLIAAESQLQSLRQIYTDNNASVRSLKARADELRAALEKIGGAGANETSSAQDLYPSLRELPVLGVTYADLLRRTKVEEAVFATLTQQDELAKVQEAKEIPSVKVLDSPEVPQKISFPPRLLIISLGTGLTGILAAAGLLLSSAWKRLDASDPRKDLAVEVWSDLRGSLTWVSRNGLSRRPGKEVTDPLQVESSGKDRSESHLSK
jgi:capsule polysaccharide export protein KpsE/RkpR